MRATQKKMMSKPVTSTLDGYHLFSASVFSGQPNVAIGQMSDENQVSNTSSSWRSATSAPSLYFARTSGRSEEHTSELQSLMRISYAVFCLKKKSIKYKAYTNKYYT